MGNILFETDFPHAQCLFGPEVVHKRIEKSLSGVPSETRRKIIWQNSADLYKVETPVPA